MVAIFLVRSSRVGEKIRLLVSQVANILDGLQDLFSLVVSRVEVVLLVSLLTPWLTSSSRLSWRLLDALSSLPVIALSSRLDVISIEWDNMHIGVALDINTDIYYKAVLERGVVGTLTLGQVFISIY